MKLALFLVAVIAASVNLIESKVFNKCDLARELLQNGIPRYQIADWVCLAYQQSRYNTGFLNKNSNGNSEYGIFQISDRWWCSNSNPSSKDCKMTCNALLDDNITDDIFCAKKIYKRHNFDAWWGWKSNCAKKNLDSYVAGCGI